MFNLRGKNLKHVPINVEFVLNRISEEEIFQKYTGETVQYGTLICSPLRSDKNPTCGFLDKGTHILFTDFSGDFGGNCFNLVSRMFSISYGAAITKVALDFGLIEEYKGKFTPLKEEQPTLMFERKPITKVKKEIQIKSRSWSRRDKEFWAPFGVTRALLEHYSVSPCQIIWIDGKRIYYYKQNNPAYAYYFNDGDFKVYFPLSKIKGKKFLGNSSKMQGLLQLKFEDDLLIITKSLKDVLVLASLGYEAVAPSAEGVILDAEIIAMLKTKYKRIVLFYDNDTAGIIGSEKNAKAYELEEIFLPVETEKDVSDYRIKHTEQETNTIIIKLLKKTTLCVK